MSLSALLLIAGLYSQGCLRGVERSQDFREVEVVYTEKNFSDLDCGRASLETRSHGEYSLGESKADGIREMDFTFRRVTLAAQSEDVATHFRLKEMCGRHGWATGLAVDITGRECDFFGNGHPFRVPAAGDKRYGIVWVGEESLYFGRLSPEFDATSPARRPWSLDPLPYKLQDSR